MPVFHLRSSLRNMSEKPTEDRPEQGTEREVQEIDDTSRGTADLRRIRFLDDCVRQHGCTRDHTGNECERVAWEDTLFTEKYPDETGHQNQGSNNNDRLSPA